MQKRLVILVFFLDANFLKLSIFSDTVSITLRIRIKVFFLIKKKRTYQLIPDFLFAAYPNIVNSKLRLKTMRDIICDLLVPAEIDESKEDQKYLLHYVSREGLKTARTSQEVALQMFLASYSRFNI